MGYQISLIVIARQPKYHRFYALVSLCLCIIVHLSVCANLHIFVSLHGQYAAFSVAVHFLSAPTVCHRSAARAAISNEPGEGS